jgi:hypothetical protein
MLHQQPVTKSEIMHPPRDVSKQVTHTGDYARTWVVYVFLRNEMDILIIIIIFIGGVGLSP